ncbi:MAG TPA: hypothetical protein VLA78_02485 [Paracoccaceae bacterium]|nr:hypothetical protein [Paracoccaceae bacterium]
MRIVYHLGVHCTDEERLLRCLLKNRAALAAEGIVVPGPARYRTLLRDTAMQLRGQPATQDTEALLLDQIMDEDAADRLILSWDNFPCYAQNALRGSQLLPGAAERMRAFAQVFPDLECEFHMAIRNPATFLPAVFAKQKGRTLEEFTEGLDPLAVRWSDVIATLRAANPEVPITVWCDEDTPLLERDVLRSLTGHSETLELEDADGVLAAIMRPEGLARLRAYLEERPPADADQRRRIVSAFLDKFALPEEIEVEITMPGWTAGIVDQMTDAYDRDVGRILRMDGVRMLLP